MKILDINKITGVIIHCSDTYATMDTDAKDIKKWHLARGWSDIGYHWIIKRDGTVESGRSSNLMGAHCKGQNANNLGVCLVGGKGKDNKPEDNFTNEQWNSLIGLLKGFPIMYPRIVNITGHNEHSNKACPSFDVQEWKKKFNIYYDENEKKS